MHKKKQCVQRASVELCVLFSELDVCVTSTRFEGVY